MGKSYRKMSKYTLSKKISDQVIKLIKEKYKSKKHKLGDRALMTIVYKEYKKAGYKGNRSNDFIYVRDNVEKFLLKPEPRRSRRRSRRSRK